MPLFVVATPIGNLEDLTFRALRTLKEVDLIAAEDTRRTAKLLAHYEIRRPVVSLREHNEARETPRLIARLEKGESIALVSDAGTPTISDPGARLVQAAHEKQILVVPIPGPNAIATALSASGLATDQFVFLGFPPSAGEARKEWFLRLGEEPRTVVFFESPHRIKRTVAELAPCLVKRQIVVARELTKSHEELVINPNKLPALKDTGEFTVVIGAIGETERQRNEVDPTRAVEMFGLLANMAGVDEQMAAKLTSVALSIRPSDVRKIIKKNKILAKRQSDGERSLA